MRKVLIVLASLLLAMVGVSGPLVPSAFAADLTFTNYDYLTLGANDVRGVYVDGSNIYAATNQGVSISTNGGTTWTIKTTANSSLGSDSVNAVYAVGSTVYAATDGGLSISTDGGGTWSNRTTEDGLGNDQIKGVFAVGSTIYAATTGGGGLSISTDGGDDFDVYRLAPIGTSFDEGLRGVYVDDGTIYVATGGGLYISIDGGISFDKYTTANGLGNDLVYGVYAVGSTIYAATGGGLSINTDLFDDFDNYTTGLGSNIVYGVYAVGSTIYAATGGGLSISTAATPAFTNYTQATNGLGTNVVQGVYAVGSTVYAATSGGLSISGVSPEISDEPEDSAVAEPAPTPTPTPTPTPSVTSPPLTLDPIAGGQNPNLPIGGLPLGGSLILVNGQPEPVTVKPDAPRNPTGLDVQGTGFTMKLGGRTTGNQPLGLSSDGALILKQDGTVFTQGIGFQPNEPVFVYLLSTPRFLGMIAADATGEFTGSLALPVDMPAGRHTLQVNGFTTDGAVRSLSVGVQVDEPSVTTRQQKARATVYFEPLSANLNATAKRTLRSIMKGRTQTSTGIVVKGFVQGNDTTANVRALSLQRARAVTAYLTSRGVEGKIVTRARGVSKKTGAVGRKATVTITYRL